jgi:hypothetical protein
MSQNDKLAEVRPLNTFTSTNTVNNLSAEDIHNADITNRVVVIRISRLKPEYWQLDRRFLVLGGGGCDPTQIGSDVFGASLLDGSAERWDRRAFAGIAANETVPTGINVSGQNSL